MFDKNSSLTKNNTLPWDGMFLVAVFYPLYTLWEANIAMEHPRFEDAFPIGKGGFPLPC